ncbi:MAG TPA: transposase [Nitrososphaeraceae archaeon]|nr:transposase [Nitrososphaeraceae archaeon]
MISSTGSVIIPLRADFTTANVPDNVMYTPMVSSTSLSSSSASTSDCIFEDTFYMIGDSRYDDQKLYDLSTNRGFELVCPVQRYEHTPINSLQHIDLYESDLGQDIYSRRSKSIEPLIEHLKHVFRIDPLPIRGYHTSYNVTYVNTYNS